MSLVQQITPAIHKVRAQEIANQFDLRALPADFLANPYPVYAALRASQPIKRMPDGSYFLTRHADLVTCNELVFEMSATPCDWGK